MRIAIVHYHLRPGGVTRVIENTQRALRHVGFQSATLAGSDSANAPLPELDYARTPQPCIAPDALADQLERAAQAALGGTPDLWHIHNPTLGRHPAATAAFAELARRGHRLLLHIHDFAEDGRPANYRHLRETLEAKLPHTLYPAAAHIQYAILNPRDRLALTRAGIPAHRLHTLPNPVLPPEGALTESPNETPHRILYPTRALRRKNIGEFLLWSALDPQDHTFTLTLAPTTPSDVAPYEQWRALAARLNLPVEFEAGLNPGATLANLLAQSAFIATTSIAEGFGLAFAEPWLANRNLAGRALPEITADLTADGLNLDALYERLDVPLAWIGAERLRTKIDAALRALAESYSEPLAPDAVDRAWNAFVHAERVDFGRLDEELQTEIIVRIANGTVARTELTPSRLYPGNTPDCRAANRTVVNRIGSLEGYAARLSRIYRELAATPIESIHAHDSDAVRRFFLDPARLYLLRST